MSKKFYLLLALTLALAASAFALWCVNKKTVAPVVTEPVITQNSGNESVDTSDWKTYRNEEYGFEVKYPESRFYITEDVDGADIIYVTVLKNGRTRIDIDNPGKIGILLNDLPTEKYSFAKKEGLCSDSSFNTYTVEICTEKNVNLDLSKDSYESFVNAGLCEGGFGFSVPINQRNTDSQERRHVVYITCDKEDKQNMEILFKVFQSIQFID